ncbi:hypothetical protein [Pseudobacteriovorax antillogorgiicola]|uniref:Uncharacterized protein n=1 Tax=Pseudobacteriovorax antillogorgiicola TaxID=1513793 RepID=A0A1Y6CEC9_9BACT|nr:hypothetical protein [Pseudobacteriovorax antillogorgiicola]TCS48288.1 hypothetical protein EDD56_11868 [Pseudobacteriovorax antillogorgiicola]SMF56902.1 hypothetical protein SAMN06296036_11873 [Pseudobacteriovorax antillogorgiicola]
MKTHQTVLTIASLISLSLVTGACGFDANRFADKLVESQTNTDDESELDQGFEEPSTDVPNEEVDLIEEPDDLTTPSEAAEPAEPAPIFLSRDQQVEDMACEIQDSSDEWQSCSMDLNETSGWLHLEAGDYYMTYDSLENGSIRMNWEWQGAELWMELDLATGQATWGRKGYTTAIGYLRPY